MPSLNRPAAALLNVLSRAASIFTMLIGLLVLIGWAFNIGVLKSILPPFATMKVNTALTFLVAGAMPWLLQTGRSKPHRLLPYLCATIVLLIGTSTLSEYIFGWDLGIDQLLFHQTVTNTGVVAPPGRMSSATAFSFMLVGCACLLLNAQRGFRIAQGLILSTGFVSLLAIIGYLYLDDVESLYHIGPYSTVALHTALTFLVLCLGLLATQTERGFMALLISESAGGLLARRLAPAALLVPVIFGWFGLLGQRAGLYETDFGLSIATIANITVFLALIWWSAGTLHRIDLRRQQAELALRQSNDELELRIEKRTNDLRDANTQLQRELAKRQQAELKFRAIVESAPDAIVITDITGQIVMVNAQTEHVFGYERTQLIGQPAELLLPPRLREWHGPHWHNYLATPDTRTMGAGLKLYGQRQDGTEFPIEVSFSPLQTAEGTLISSAIRNITERKQARDALRQSEERFRLLVEGVRDYAIFMLDATGHIVSWNLGAERIKGYRAQEIIGQHFSRFYPAADVQHGKPEQELAIAVKEREFHEEGTRVRKDGSQFIADVTITALFDEAGALRGFAKVTCDITSRKQAEAALRYSEEKLRTLFNVLPVGVSILDEQHTLDQHYNITEMNPALIEMTAISQAGLLQGQYTDWTYIRPDGSALSLAEFPSKLAMQAGSIRDVELGIIKGDQEIVWASISAVKLPEPQHGVVVVTVDITKRKLADEQLRASIREKEMLLREIHHRVKNNLQVISSLLKLQAATINDPKTLEIFQESQHRVRSMSLVHETLYQSGDLARIDFEQYLRQLIRYLGQAYGVRSSGVAINLNVEEVLLDLDTAMSCGLIINELVSNALKYAFPTEIEIGRVGEIRIELSEVQEHIALTVGDNGVGLPAELQLQQLHSLGLQLVYGLIRDELDGTIEVERHNGTCFKLTFPALPQASSQHG